VESCNGFPLTTLPATVFAQTRPGSYRYARAVRERALSQPSSSVQANCARRLGLALRNLVRLLANLKKRGLLAQHAAIHPLELSLTAHRKQARQLQISNLSPARVRLAQPSNIPVGTSPACPPSVHSAEATGITHTTLQTLTRIFTLTAAPLEQDASHCATIQTTNNVPQTAPAHRPAVPHSNISCDTLRRLASRPPTPFTSSVCTRTIHPLTGTCIDAHRLLKRRS
jgi:hypothetical protein